MESLSSLEWLGTVRDIQGKTEGMMSTQTIVLAKVEMTGLRATGRNIMKDRNWFPEFEAAPEAKAMVWLNRGTAADIEKAQCFAEANGYTVLTFPTSGRDQLAKAKAIVMESFGVNS
mgnify:CR=1 FL=1